MKIISQLSGTNMIAYFFAPRQVISFLSNGVFY
jgi:hypothetical protein